MKKVLIVLAVIIGIIIAALLIIPTFFKGDIIKIIQNQSSKYINADLKIEDVSLSMFKSFPSLNVGLKNVIVTGKDEFAQDTIANIPLFEASVNLMSLISGNEIIINKILLRDARLLPTVSTTGKANWDILISDTTSAVQPATPETNKDEKEKGIRLNDISVENLYVAYNDYPNAIFASIEDTDLQLSGNFSESNTLLDILLNLNNIYFRQQNSIWISNTSLSWTSEIGANLKDMIFDIRKNDLAINDLKLDLTGSVGIEKEKYNVNLKLNAPDTKFESLLALVPKDFQKEIEGLKTSGDFNLEVSANGAYYENHLPALDAKLLVNNASVQYPGLPEAINKINIDLNITNPGGPVDSTVLSLKQMSFLIAKNPFNMHLKVANLNDPTLAGGINGTINFENLKKALPLKDITLQGTVNTDITFNGKYQYIEKEEYEKFIAKGSIVLNNILFKNAGFPQGISIPQGSITVTPAKLNLNNLQAKVYSSDFTLQGNISNYLPYIFKNGTIKGNFTLNSNQINLNEFMAAAPATDTTKATGTATAATSAGSALEIPKNINLQLTTNVNTLLFDNLTIKNIKGNISLADAVATLGNLSMNMLNGSMVVNGKYNAVIPQAPKVDLNLNVSDFDINAVYNSFSFIKKSIPIAMNCSGRISSSMKFNAALDKEMNLVMNTVNGAGNISSQGVLINDNPAMNQLASILKNDELSRISISSLKIDFKVQNGNITVEPFKTTLAGNPVTIYGNQSVEGNIDYTLSMNVARKYFGKDINNLLGAIPGSNNIQALDIDARITGTLSKPVVKPDLTKAINALKNEAEKELKNKAKDEILKGLNKLFK